MTTTSLKYRNFVDEPMSNKPVTDLAGIGPTIGKRLSDRGYDKVCKNFGVDFGSLINCADK